MSENAITAIIPAYNAEKFLTEAIQSILAQTRPVEQIIVVDDGSTDRTAEIAQSFSEVLFLQMAKGPGPATPRNIAIKRVQTPLIAWIDADDLWEPYHLESVAALLDEHQEAGAACSPVVRFGSRSGIQPCIATGGKPVYAVDECFYGTCLPAMSAITRTSVTRAIGGYDESFRIAPDFDFWLRMSLHCPFVSLDTPTAKYRWHSNQISANSSGLPLTMRQREAVYRSRFRFANGDVEGTENLDLERYRELIRTYYKEDLPLVATNCSAEERQEFEQIASLYVPGIQRYNLRRKILGMSPKIGIRLYLKAIRTFKTYGQ